MRRRDIQAAVLIALTLLAAAFLIGSVPRWATCISAAAATVCALPYLRSSRAIAGGLHKAPLLAFIGAAFALTALQLIPLPAFLTELISPARFDLAADNAAALGEDSPAFIPLTVDPPASLVELAKLAGYLLFALACLRLVAAGSRARALLMGSVALTGAAVALTALAHEAIGATSLFGVYEPAYAGTRLLAPFLNPNHLAAYTGLSAQLSLGLAVYTRGLYRTAWLGAFFLCAGVALLSASRGGALALVAALSLFAILYRFQARAETPGKRAPRSTAIAMGVIVLCAAVILAALTAGPVASQIAETARPGEISTEVRVELWTAGTEIARDYPAAGVGRGAFVHVVPHAYTSRPLFAYLENGYLQAVVDFGIPAALALAGILAWLFATAARRAASSRATSLEIGALGGLALLAIHNFVDFNLELPGVALAGIAVAACVTPPKLAGVSSREKRRALVLRSAAVALALAIIALAATPIGKLARASTHLGVAEQRGTEAAENAFRRHPANYMTAGELAYALYRDGDPRALRVANRALYFSPDHADLHLLTARMLAASDHPEQARVHYRRALETGGARPAVIREVISQFPDPETAVRAFPLDPQIFPRLLRRLRSEDPELALDYSRRFARLAGEDDPAVLLAISDIERRAGDLARAASEAKAAYDAWGDADSARALAAALSEAGQDEEAIHALQSALAGAESPAERAVLLTELSDLQRRAGDLEAARDSLVEITDSVVPRRVAARAHRRLANIEDDLENTNQAEWHRRRADRLSE